MTMCTWSITSLLQISQNGASMEIAQVCFRWELKGDHSVRLQKYSPYTCNFKRLIYCLKFYLFHISLNLFLFIFQFFASGDSLWLNLLLPSLLWTSQPSPHNLHSWNGLGHKAMFQYKQLSSQLAFCTVLHSALLMHLPD